MIIEFYENPNKPAKPVYNPPANQGTMHQHGPNGRSSFSSYPQPPLSDNLIEFYANKKNITPEEFKRRDAIVRKEAAKAVYMRGDSVYPWNWEQYQRYGMCRIIGIYRTYQDMEGNDWPENDMPYIVTACPISRTNENFFATANFFQRFCPPSQPTNVVDVTPKE